MFEIWTLLLSMLGGALGFFLARWFMSGGKKTAVISPTRPAAQTEVPRLNVAFSEEVTDTPQTTQGELRKAERPRPGSAVPFSTPPSEGGLRQLEMRGSQNVQIGNLNRLRSVSQNRIQVPRELIFERVHLTDAERAGIETIKQWLERDGIDRCKIPGHHAADDSFIGRFVRGKRLDLHKAYEQLKGSLLWRKENRIDTIREWFRKEYADVAESIDHYFPWQNHGVDHHGVNVIWDRLPSMDFRTLMGAFKREDLINWHVETLETNMQRLYEAGQFGGVFIEDFTGLSMAHWYKPAVDFLQLMMNIDQSNYPELSAAIFYINAPRVLSVLWPLLKPLMDPLTVAKVHISSSVPVDDLCRFMPISSIPKEYGGSGCEHSTVRCLDYSLGGPFLSTKDKKIVTTRIPPRSTEDVKLTITEPSQLHWSIQCADNGDIDVKMIQDETGAELHSLGRVAAHTGTLNISKPGTYTIRYNNEFSYWNGKVVGYHHRVEPLKKPIQHK